MRQSSLPHPDHLLPLIPTLQLCHLHQIHSLLLKSCLHHNHNHSFLFSKLIAAAALLDVSYAHSLLLSIPTPPLFSFNSLLRGYSLSPHPHNSFPLFNSLRSLGLHPDPFSYIAAFKSAARARSFLVGRQLHASALKSRHYPFLNLRNALIHFYCSCEDIRSARHVFDEMRESKDSISWSTLINGYLQIGEGSEVVRLFVGMRRCGFEINPTTAICLLSSSSWDGGGSVHGHCVKSGLILHLNVATAVAAMYTSSGCLKEARLVFEQTGRRDVVLYNCVVDGYAKAGYLEECLSLLRRMKGEWLKINSGTLVGLFEACAASGALIVGRRVHEIVKEEKLELDAALGTAILDMYVKCGCIDDAMEVFAMMKSRDVTAWTAMIMGFGIHGRAEDAIRMFGEMEEEGVRPNDVTFLAVLNACSHGLVVELGKDTFKKMVLRYEMKPSIKHYGCIIDLLGRVGQLEEAYELIRNLPVEGDATAWRALLAGCRVHGDVRLGRLARNALVALGSEHPTDSILLASTFASSGKGEDVGRMSDQDSVRVKTTGKKEAGYSSIEMSM